MFVIYLCPAGQTYAWTPSITGTKPEEPLLAGERHVEYLTEITCWPTCAFKSKGQIVQRPAILEIN